MIEPMPCSRTPKRRLRPSGCAAEKSGEPLMTVLFDGARSAEPPASCGSFPASALITCPEAARVGMCLPVALHQLVPLALQLPAALPRSLEGLAGGIRNGEGRLRGPAQGLL